MSRKNGFFIGLVVIALVAVLKLAGTPASPLVEPVLVQGGSLPPESEWFSSVHLGYNGWLSWRIDPFFSRLASLCPAPHSAIYGLLFIFHTLGIAALCLLVAPAVGLRSALVAGILTGALLLQIFSLDLVVLGGVVWWPWITLILVQTCRIPLSRVFPFLIILLFFGLRATKSGNVVAPFVIGFGIALAGYLGLNVERPRRLGFVLGALAALLPLALVTRFIETGALPDYPPTARVLPIDGTLGFTRALVGPERDLPIIDRAAIADGYSALAVALLLFTAWGWLLTRRDRPTRPAISGVLVVTTILIASALWDTLAPVFAEISPLRSLGRLVPALSFAPLAPIAVAITVPLLIVTFTFAQRLTPLAALTLFILGGSYLKTPLGWSWISPPGLVHGVSAARAVEARHVLTEATSSGGNDVAKNLISPSAGILLREGFTVGARAVPPDVRFTPVAPLIERIVVSHGAEQVSALTDRDKKTRWSAGRGVQIGDEWMRIHFKAPTQIAGLELDPGPFVTDFPSGLEIVAPPDCSTNEGPAILSIPRWLGPIRSTPKGYLYYGEERAVQVRFPSAQTVPCLVIRQTGSGRSVDWSVAELSVLPPQ